VHCRFAIKSLDKVVVPIFANKPLRRSTPPSPWLAGLVIAIFGGYRAARLSALPAGSPDRSATVKPCSRINAVIFSRGKTEGSAANFFRAK
jgi:hypothetical protein